MSTSKIDALLQWAKVEGADYLPNIQFKSENGSIGAYCTETNDATIKIPLKIIITLEDAIKSFSEGSSDDYSKISLQTSNINSLLKMYLARERSSASYFEPYLSLLPTLLEINSPYTWSAADKLYLKGTNLGGSLRENLTQLIEEWWEIINLLPKDLTYPTNHFVNMKFYYEHKFYNDEDLYQYFSQDDPENWTCFTNYLWSSLILKSRSFPSYLVKDFLNHQVKQDEAMLLPLVDLLNHDLKAKVDWSVSKDGFFQFKADDVARGQLYNNYGMKGNEELLLAYGFCLEDNQADSAAVKIKLPEEMVTELEQSGVKLPKMEDYTTSVIRNHEKSHSSASQDKPTDSEDPLDVKALAKPLPSLKSASDGLLFFLTKDHVPTNLIQTFQFLVKNKWEDHVTLRAELAGINQLRQAIESKSNMIDISSLDKVQGPNSSNISIYCRGQKKILQATLKTLKRTEKDMLTNSEYKRRFITLKNVYKKDLKFQQSLLVSLGVTSFESILESEFQDQCWLLYLMRCLNRDEYLASDIDDDGDEENYLPKWIKDKFLKLENETEVAPAEIVQYKDLYLGLVPELATAVPEIYNRGRWGVKEMILSGKLLELISFVRGKDQESILVNTE